MNQNIDYSYMARALMIGCEHQLTMLQENNMAFGDGVQLRNAAGNDASTSRFISKSKKLASITDENIKSDRRVMNSIIRSVTDADEKAKIMELCKNIDAYIKGSEQELLKLQNNILMYEQANAPKPKFITLVTNLFSRLKAVK